MRASTSWDLVVIGGGTAGIVGSRTAAALGAKALLLERERPGGDCLWTGCVPSKALLAAAAQAAHARRADRLGARTSVDVDFAAVMRHVRASIATIAPVDSPEALRAHGVEVRAGEARFTGPRTLVVGGETITFRHALVATGASASVPPVPGLHDAEPLTSDSVWDLTDLPERLVVVGGGSIGCELSQAFARLGSQVTLVETLPRILVGEDPDAAAIIHDALEADGVEILPGHQVVRVVGSSGAPGEVILDAGAGERTLPYDEVLVATGRKPRTKALDLAAAGVDLDENGFVAVDGALRTSNSRVWAAGDVTPRPQFTHVAGVDASIAASNAVLGLRRRADEAAIPRVTFTDPELAAVGAASWADGGVTAPRVATEHHRDVDRAITDGRTDGFSRLVLGSREKIIGATIVGPRAGEALAEATLAITQGLSATDVSNAIHPYPTYGDGIWNASIGVVRARLAAPATRRLTGAVVRLRAAWTDLLG